MWESGAVLNQEYWLLMKKELSGVMTEIYFRRIKATLRYTNHGQSVLGRMGYKEDPAHKSKDYILLLILM